MVLFLLVLLSDFFFFVRLLCIADAKDDPCHAISVQLLIELAVRNPRGLAKCGGMKELFHLMVDPPNEELLPVLASVFSYLLDDEFSRQFVMVPLDVRVLLAPLTDTFQCDEPVVMQTVQGPPGQPAQQQPAPPPPPILGDNQSTIRRWSNCVKAIVLMMKSWSGCFIMAASGGFQSMVSALLLPSMNLHSLVLDGLLELFRIAIPNITADSNPFLGNAVEDNKGRSSTLSADSLQASSTTILDLPSRSKVVRHDWMLNYLSFLVINFKKCGLFEALVLLGDKGEQVGGKSVTDADEEARNEKRRQNGIKATILLGELLDMSQKTLAPAMVKELHTLPTLVKHAALFDQGDGKLQLTDKRVRTRAGAMVAHLQQWASLKGEDSSFVGQVNTSGANKFRRIRGQNRRLDRIEDIRLKMEWDIDEATLQARLRATGVLATKDWNKWDFRLMSELLEGPLTNPSRIEMALGTKFFKRILSFARPSNNQLFSLPWSARNLRYVQVVCLVLEVLTLCDAGSAFLMQNKLIEGMAKMISDEVEFVQSKQKDDPDRPLSPERMVRTIVKEYFTLIGTLSGNKRGIAILNDSKIFSLLVPLISSGRSDLCKMIMTSLDYSQAGSARVLLSKVLQNKTMPIRYLAARHLHFLLRAGAAEFQSWGIEFACKALKDPESRIVRAAVTVLDEASDDQEMLAAFIARKPDMLLENHPGKFLVYRFLSHPKGFEYLNQTSFIENELELWGTSELEAYSADVEQRLMEMTFSDVYKQTETVSEGGVVHIMPHLYGELAKSEAGFGILQQNKYFVQAINLLKHEEKNMAKLRAALWAAGHVGATTLGFQYLLERGVIEAILDLCMTCTSLSTRGTCLMVLGLISSTEEGRNHLRQTGWSQPIAEVPRLVAVPNDVTLDFLMQVPQPVYTGGSWTPNFNDTDLLDTVRKSARQEQVLSARHLREQAAASLNQSSPPPARKLEAIEQQQKSGGGDTAAPSAPLRAISGRGVGRARPIARPPPGAAVAAIPANDEEVAPADEAPVAPTKRVPLSPRGRGRGSITSADGTTSPPAKVAPRSTPARSSGSTSSSMSKVPPLTKLQDAIEKSEFEENPLKDTFSEDQKTILKLIVDMTSHITTEKALRQLKKMRMQQAELFLDPEVFLASMKLMEMYRFKLMIRRFVYDLFGECLITHQQFRSLWDEDGKEEEVENL